MIRKIRNLLRALADFAIGIPVIGLCYLLKPVKKIRFGHLYTSRIGHLCFNFDNYVAHRRERGSSELAVFIRDGSIANNAMFAIWQREPGIWFTQLARPVVWVLAEFFPSSSLLIPFGAELHPLPTTISASPAEARLSDAEQSAGKALVKSLGITTPFVCFHNRDSAYLGRFGGDGNSHDFRDFTFESLKPAIFEVMNRGYGAVRLGELVEIEADISSPYFHSMTGAARTDFSDVYLGSQALFFVGGNSGISQIPRVFRKPELLVNYIPFKIIDLSAWSAGSLFLPKKLYSMELGRSLTFKEMNDLPYDIHYEGDFFGDRGIKVIDNSVEEISDAVLEMEARVRGVWVDSAEQERLQSQFWKSLPNSCQPSLVRDALGIWISSRFLERNPEML